MRPKIKTHFKINRFDTSHSNKKLHGRWAQLNASIWTKPFSINVHWRHPHYSFGRFGGGWNWELGFQWGGGTLLINCLTFTIRINIDRDTGFKVFHPSEKD